jgi:putative ABC transport system permease protein
MLADFRIAARRLVRQPGHTALAVTILALGLGATTAMFSLVSSALLRPLPFPAAERLTSVGVGVGAQNATYAIFSPFVFRHLRAHNEVFDQMAAFAPRTRGLAVPGQTPQPAWALAVTADFFPLLGVRPALGRVFLPEEDQAGRNQVVVLSARSWQERFGGDPAIVGRSLRFGAETVTVVGVMPPEFSDPLRRWTRVDLWRPMALSPEAMSPASTESLQVWARLKPGITREAAEAHLNGLVARIGDGQRREVELKPWARKTGLDDESGLAVWFALGLAVFVLVIACTNLAGVQLARLAGRGHEQAIRVALGASRGRLVREAFAESALVSLVGAGLGLLLAVWCTDLLSGRLVLAGGDQVTVGLPIEIDGRVLAFALASALASALIVGTAPVWLSARGPLFDTLRKAGRATTDRARPRLRSTLVVGEMALALVLLMGGGLFLRGLQRLQVDDPGWKVDGLLTGEVSLTGPRYAAPGGRAAVLDQLEQGLRAIPGVAGSALAEWLPVERDSYLRVQVEGLPDQRHRQRSYLNAVSPGYFAALGIVLQEGRLLADADAADGLPVVVISETMARDLWPVGSAIGKRIRFAHDDPTAPASFKAWKTVVGVVAHVRFPGDLEDPGSLFQAYYPIRQQLPGTVALALRTSGPPEALIGALREAVARIDPALVVTEAISARASIDRALANFGLLAWITFGFAGMGLLLSALGVYGLFAGFVVERTREIGVRMALGARREQVAAMVLRRGARLAGLGALAGMLAATAVVPVLRAIAHQLPAHEPMVVVGLAAVLLVVALLASWLPARRAAALDPMAALRQE